MLQNPRRFCNVVSQQVNIPLVQLEKAVSSCELCAFPGMAFRAMRFRAMLEIMAPEVFDLRISAGAFQCPGDCVLRNPLPVGALKPIR